LLLLGIIFTSAAFHFPLLDVVNTKANMVHHRTLAAAVSTRSPQIQIESRAGNMIRVLGRA
jgi:hypothetical protein